MSEPVTSSSVSAASAPAAAPPKERVLPRPRAAAASSGPVAQVFGALVRFFSSFGLAVTLLLLLMTLTLLGTLEQGTLGLYETQRKYFESMFLVHRFGSLPVPLPGASLVLALLSINLVVGGIVRMRRRVSTIGILIVHAGILLLFGGSLVEFLYSDKGHMTLFEGQSSAAFQSYFEWEIAARERLPDGTAKEFVLPYDRLDSLEPSDVARFHSKDLPFVLEVTGWTHNAQPRRVGPPSSRNEGWEIQQLPPEKEAERDMPAAYVALVSPSLANTPSAITAPSTLLWGARGVEPWVVTSGGRRFEIELRSRQWELPFSIALDRFVHVEHPGISMAKEFSSYVTKNEGGVAREIHITMNEPLRHKGYTFFQSGWGPDGAPAGTPLFSTFSVVRNPSDRMPIISCLVIAFGLAWHLVRKLILHIQAESARRAVRSPA